MYKVIEGDTYSIVSRKVYGTEQYAGLLRKANPGVIEPFVVGTTLNTPSLPKSTRITSIIGIQNSDEVVLKINNQRFRFWTSVTISLSYDSMSTVEFTAPWDSSDDQLRAAFRPFSYSDISVEVGGDLLFVGYAVNPQPTVNSNSKTISLSCYAKPAFLNDCTPTLAGDQLEFQNVGLPEIAASLCAPFGVPVQFENGGGSTFEQVACEPTNPVLSFLTTLAKQQNMVIGNTPRGRLQFKRFKPGGNVGTLRQGESPLLIVDPIFGGQQYFSDVTGISLTDVGSDTARYTQKNPFAAVFRPTTFVAQDIDGGELVDAVSAKTGRMFADAIIYSIEVATWRNPEGDLWEPGQIITLHAPDAMVYNPYQFMIKDVKMVRTTTSKTAVLTLVLPQAYAGELPESLPWD